MSSRHDYPFEANGVGVGTPYRNISTLVGDRDRMVMLSDAMSLAQRNLSKDDCGQWSIKGKGGRLQTYGDVAYQLYVTAHSSRKWGAIKRKAKAFGWSLTQDGDDEGCFDLGLPEQKQSKFLRTLLGLRSRPVRSSEIGTSKGVLPT